MDHRPDRCDPQLPARHPGVRDADRARTRGRAGGGRDVRAAMHERWHAVRGGGAWSGKRRLHVSQVSQLEDAQVFYASRKGFAAAGKERGFDAVVSAAWRDRGFGDFWGYALVSEGAGEAMFEPELYSWDLAAPLILVEEAGGRLTDFKGNRTYSGGNALASNGLLHDVILEKLNGA